MSHGVSGFSDVIDTHAEVRKALRDTATYSSDLQGDADVRDYRQIPLEIDPPRHHLYRTALSPIFVKPTIEKLIPAFTDISQTIINDFFSKPTDVVSGLALPIVMKNLGVIYNRSQDVDEWISWGPDVWTAAGPTRSGDTLHRYLDRVYQEALQKTDREDVWSQIARLEIDGKVVTENEFRGIAGVLLAGGRDTVVKLFSGIIWHFGNNHDDFDYLLENPVGIDNAIQELLRFLAPLPSMARTKYPESLSKQLPADRYVKIDFIAANFDDSVFENPHTINIKRERIPHLSFGFGPHTCLGNHIAEIETKVFLQVLLAKGRKWQISPDSIIVYHSAPLTDVPERFQDLLIKLR